jgi:hypothetical protein
VDSEHSAIFQCLDGKPTLSVRKLLLTASGGPFRSKTDWPKEKFSEITVERALKHPSWVMGRKITIDSATLFNKGLEMIEARWLFDIEMARVGVVVHPQSVIHSMVEFVDGSLLAQLSTPDMCLPIQYALTYPDRARSERVQTDFPKIGSLTFEEPDVELAPASFLYSDMNGFHFMDEKSFEQFSFSPEDIDSESGYLKEGLSLQVLKYNGAPVSLQFPQYVELAVVSTELGLRGDTAAGGASKQATLETGLNVRVPLFIKEGEIVRVNTQTGEVAGRA